MRTHMHHLTAALVAALIAWSGPAPLPATEYEASDYLPLAVGNSWTFGHFWSLQDGYGLEELDDRFIEGNWPAYVAQYPNTPQLTITVERTEEIDGETYYVLSDMPSGGWPPAPPHFISGKKLRWEGTSLVEHDGTGEQTFFRFDGSGTTGYTIPTTEDDNRVTSRWSPWGVTARYGFTFHGHDGYGHDDYGDWPPASRLFGFVAGYGIAYVTEAIYDEDYPIFINRLSPIQATLPPQQSGGAGGKSGSRVVMYEDARYGTSAPSSSWGQVKGEER